MSDPCTDEEWQSLLTGIEDLLADEARADAEADAYFAWRDEHPDEYEQALADERERGYEY